MRLLAMREFSRIDNRRRVQISTHHHSRLEFSPVIIEFHHCKLQHEQTDQKERSQTPSSFRLKHRNFLRLGTFGNVGTNIIVRERTMDSAKRFRARKHNYQLLVVKIWFTFATDTISTSFSFGEGLEQRMGDGKFDDIRKLWGMHNWWDNDKSSCWIIIN